MKTRSVVGSGSGAGAGFAKTERGGFRSGRRPTGWWDADAAGRSRGGARAGLPATFHR
jgi:hypothetical protein